MGWDQDFLQQAVNTCTNPSGLIDDCALFNVVDQSVAMQCQLEDMPANLRKEDGNGPFAELPGDVMITNGNSPGGQGGQGQKKPSSTPTKGSSAPTLPYQAGVTAPVKGSPLPGQVFKEGATDGSSGMQIAAVDAPKAAVTPAPAGPAANAPATFISTQYITVGNVVSEILWKQEYVTVTEDAKPSTTVTVTATGARPAKQRRTVHGHGHGHGHSHGQGQL
jgi:hypothetical protein